MAKFSTFIAAITLSIPATLAAHDGAPLQLIEPQPAVISYDIKQLPPSVQTSPANCQPEAVQTFAVNARTETLKAGELKSATGNVKFSEYTEPGDFTDSQLTITREDNPDTGIKTFTVKNFSSSLTLPLDGIDKNVDMSFDVHGYLLTKIPANLYLGAVNIDGTDYLAYASFDKLEYIIYNNGTATLSGALKYNCYYPNSSGLAGSLADAQFTITIPQELFNTNSIDTSGWTVAEGDWQYLSRYTGISYPTEVRYMQVIDAAGNPTDYVRMALTNEFFGTVYLNTNLVTGDTSSYVNVDENNRGIYPRVNDEQDATAKTISISYTGAEQGYGSWSAYPLSGSARLFARYIPLVDGYIDTTDERDFYDYLYNTQAKDCKIKADYAKGYYHGEKTAKVSLQRGEGVTDVYYIMAREFFDEKRTQADAEMVEYGRHYDVTRSFVDEYIAEYKAGESNEAYIVGRVDDNATEFEIPLPDCDGMRSMIIVACSGNQITDMVFDMIELRRPCEWKSYGTITLNNNMGWNEGGQTYEMLTPGDYEIEVNPDNTFFRIVKPFATDKNPDANYLYLNATLGIEHCYLDPSYTPVEHHYDYQDLTGNEQVMRFPYLMLDIASYNIFNLEFDPLELLVQVPGFFINFSNGVANLTALALERNIQSYQKEYNYGSIYVNYSYSGSLNFKLTSAVVATPDITGVNFEVGVAVNHLICTFGYDAAPAEMHPASAGSDDPSFRVDIEAGTGSIDISALVLNHEIPQSPKRIYYTAYDVNGNALRTGDLDLSGYNFAKAFCNIVYTNSTQNCFSNAKLAITREDNADTGAMTFTVENISSTMQYANSVTNISFEVKDNALTTGIASFYINTLSLSSYGNLDVYAEFQNLEYTATSDGATLTGEVYYNCCKPGTQESIGYYDAALFTITIPKELLFGMSGIVDPVTATDGNGIDPVYYDLQGIWVDNPAPGSVLIEAKGNKTRKIIYND